MKEDETTATADNGQPTTESSKLQAPSSKLKAISKRLAKTPQSIVMDWTLPKTGRRLSAEWEAETTDHTAQAWLYDGRKCVARITFFGGYQSRPGGDCEGDGRGTVDGMGEVRRAAAVSAKSGLSRKRRATIHFVRITARP